MLCLHGDMVANSGIENQVIRFRNTLKKFEVDRNAWLAFQWNGSRDYIGIGGCVARPDDYGKTDIAHYGALLYSAERWVPIRGLT